MLLEVLAAKREVLGPRHPHTLATMGKLAIALRELGKHAEAQVISQELEDFNESDSGSQGDAEAEAEAEAEAPEAEVEAEAEAIVRERDVSYSIL